MWDEFESIIDLQVIDLLEIIDNLSYDIYD